MNAPQKSSRIGDHIGRYRITRELSRGGTGAVYEAVQDSIGFRAAVKILDAKLADDPRHQQYVSRFLDEARAVNLLEHPGVVRIFDFGDLPDRTVYIMMEMLDGPTLADRLDRMQRGASPRMSPLRALQIARQIASVMAQAHDKGLIHRDLKPDNIVLMPDSDAPGRERAKLLDFGLAKFLDSPERRTTAGLALGTPLYMSPEQCLGAANIDGKTDVYSLGVMLYHMLTGQPPFTGEARAVMVSHTSAQPRHLRELMPALPGAVTELVHETLAKGAGERPGMGELEARMESLERSGLVPDVAVGLGEPAARAYPQTVAVRRAGQGSRRMIVAALAGAGAVLAAGGIGVLIGQRMHPPQGPAGSTVARTQPAAPPSKAPRAAVPPRVEAPPQDEAPPPAADAPAGDEAAPAPAKKGKRVKKRKK